MVSLETMKFSQRKTYRICSGGGELRTTSTHWPSRGRTTFVLEEQVFEG